MRALRTHYTDEQEFARRVDEVQRPEGYRLVGAFEDERCVAVAGFHGEAVRGLDEAVFNEPSQT